MYAAEAKQYCSLAQSTTNVKRQRTNLFHHRRIQIIYTFGTTRVVRYEALQCTLQKARDRDFSKELETNCESLIKLRRVFD